MNILFALAIAMAVGMAMTRLIKLIHLPNVTAYLIAGLLVGPYVLKVLTPEMNSKLSIISDVALGFIAYSIGSEFKFSYIKEIGAKPMVITAFEGCVASLLVFLTLLVGMLTGVGGGVLRDLCCMERPYISTKHIYACASLAGAAACMLLWSAGENLALLTGCALTVVLRLCAAVFRWSLPKA